MTIVNSGYMGIVFNFAPNFGVQAGINGGAAGGTGLVFNYSNNFGLQAGTILR